MTSKNSLSTKIILMVEAILLISSVLFCTVSIYRARVGIRKAIQQRMLDIANCASGSLQGDVLESLTEKDIGSHEYNDIYNTLAVFRDNVELEYVYSIREEDDGNFIFTMDLDQVSPASYGDSVKYTEALASAGRGTAAVDEVPYSDAWGRFYSAYSPVFDSKGAVAGIIAVDFTEEWFESQLSAQTRSTVISYVIILMFSLLVAAALSLITVRPYVQMEGKLLEDKIHAESASRAKSEFLANMSHELRTPINAVLGMNEMILRESLQAYKQPAQKYEDSRRAFADIHNYAGNIQSAGNNLLSIINDILDFSKIEAGRFSIVEADYKLSAVLNDVSNMFAFKAREKGLDFRVNVDPSLPDDLCGDALRVRQIFVNLLSNAVKYTEKGSVMLSVCGDEGKEPAAGEQMCLTVTVRDTGIGIRPEDFDKLFEKFERMDLKKNSTVEGTGLGLAITRKLLDMMDGHIEVESKYGEGSTFTAVFMQKVASTETVGDFEEKFARNIEETKGYRKAFYAPDAHILAVDDTRMNLAVITNLLKNTGIRIDTAVSGEEAIRLSRTTCYDLILMDQRMPEMDGTETMRLIRGQEGGASKKTPFICLTADAVSGARERYLAEGFTDYLAKPIDSRQLEQVLIKYLPAHKVMTIQEEKSSIQKEKSSIREEKSASQEEKPSVREEKSSIQEEKPATGVVEITGTSEDPFFTLRKEGIDPEVGLRYCDGDTDMFRMLLTEYAKNAEEKARELKKYFDEQDWHNYAVSVHALKSTSKMIGAAGLSYMAAGMEAAADIGQGDTNRHIHDDMMSRYTELAKVIGRTVGSGKEPAKDEEIIEFQPKEDEEIIEFQPEEDVEIIDFQPEEDKEIIEFQPEEDKEIIEFQPEEDEEIIEFQPEEDKEIIEFQPEEDEEIIEFQPEENYRRK